jgi:hypothetical protein
MATRLISRRRSGFLGGDTGPRSFHFRRSVPAAFRVRIVGTPDEAPPLEYAPEGTDGCPAESTYRAGPTFTTKPSAANCAPRPTTMSALNFLSWVNDVAEMLPDSSITNSRWTGVETMREVPSGVPSMVIRTAADALHENGFQAAHRHRRRCQLHTPCRLRVSSLKNTRTLHTRKRKDDEPSAHDCQESISRAAAKRSKCASEACWHGHLRVPLVRCHHVLSEADFFAV